MIPAFTLFALLLVSGASAARSVTYKETIGTDFAKYSDSIYQSCFLKKTNNIYVSRAVGRPPIKEGDLLVADADTLKITKDIKAPYINNRTGLLADYGLFCDDDNQRVWVTNTRQNTVSFFDAADDDKRTTWPLNTIQHPRDIVVDSKTGYAWASSASDWNSVLVFSANKTDGPIKTVNITEQVSQFSFPMSVAIDESTRSLYTISLNNNTAVSINLDDYKIQYWDLTNSKESSGIAIDTKRNHLYVANQGSNNTVVLSVKSGKILKDIPIGDSALNAAYDPTFDLVYITSMSGNAIYVIDPSDYSVITKLNVTSPDRVNIGPKGEVYVTGLGEPAASKWTPIIGKASSNVSSSVNSTSSGVAAVKPLSNTAAKAIPALPAFVAAGLVTGALALF